METKNFDTKYCVGLGEILFDVLPSGSQLGGAPANFAYHAGQHGLHSVAVSAVGKDVLGETALRLLDEKKLKYVMPEVEFPTGTVFLRMMKTRTFFVISVVMMALSMIGMWVGESKTMLYIAIALVGYGNSNEFSMIFSQALLALPDKKNEVSGLMIMGLFGGTIFPLFMGFASDTFGQVGAVAVMAVGVAYLFTYIRKL